MNASFIPILPRRLLRSGRFHEFPTAFRQAFVLLALLLFVLAAIFPADSQERIGRGGEVATATLKPSPCDLLMCDGSTRTGGGRTTEGLHEVSGDQVRYVEGLGFTFSDCSSGRCPAPKLSEHF